MRNRIIKRFRRYERRRRGDEIELHLGAPAFELSSGSTAAAGAPSSPEEHAREGCAASPCRAKEHSAPADAQRGRGRQMRTPSHMSCVCAATPADGPVHSAPRRASAACDFRRAANGSATVSQRLSSRHGDTSRPC
jgi:hypothetical protein